LKKLAISIIIIAIILNVGLISYGTTENENPVENTPQAAAQENAGSIESEEVLQPGESVQEDVEENSLINAVGKVIKNTGITEVDTGLGKSIVQNVRVEVLDGDYIGEEFDIEYTISYDSMSNIKYYELEEGDKVQLQISEDKSGAKTVVIQDIVREKYIFILFILFLISIFAICGRKSIRTILSLVFSIFIIIFVLINNIYKGENEILFSLISLVCIVFGSFFILCGPNRKSLSASIGTALGVGMSSLIALVFFKIAKLSGDIDKVMQYNVSLSAVKFDIRELLFVTVIIATVGAAMDVAMSIVNKLEEVKVNNPDVTWKEMFIEGLNIGRNDISTMDNTLLLIYISSIITPILLSMTNGYTAIETLNKSMIAEQIIIALSGSIGIMLTTPITSIVFSLINKDRVVYNTISKNRLDGKRSLKL